MVSGLPGRLIPGVPVEQIRGKMVDRAGTDDVGTDTQTRPEQAPKVYDALGKGVFVSVDTWGGRGLTGTICDRELTGLLLDVGEPEDDPGGYVFLPWSSIEQVNIGALTPRRVKVIPG